MPHTADVIIEAWADTAAGCIEEALTALTATFAARVDDRATRGLPVSIDAAPRDQQLLRVLEEALFVLDREGMVVIGAALTERADGGLSGMMQVVPVDAVELIGAVPKAVSYEDLECAPRGDVWQCRALVDL